MSLATATLKGIGPILFGAPVHGERRDDETPNAYEERTWAQKAAVDKNGHVVVNAAAVHRALSTAASWLNMKLPGGAGGKATFKKRFDAGVMPAEPWYPVLVNGKPTTITEDNHVRLYVPSNGQRGGSTRVWRHFPRIDAGWTLVARLLITDESITQDVLEKHLLSAGLHDGLGSMRIGKGGPNGMFGLESLTVEPYTM